MTELDGAVVLVVGASGGLGSRIADALTERGATVLRASRQSGAGGDGGSPAGPADALPLGDLRREDTSPALLAQAVDVHGRLDGLVIAAGTVAFGPASTLADTVLRDLFEVNALAPIRLIREALPHLAESSKAGRSPFVITMSGIVSEVPTNGLAAYSAAKAALAAFTVASTRELRRSGIRIIDARPGHTETGLSERPIDGVAPSFPVGLDPDAVAARIVQAIVDDERDLPSTAFAQ